MSVCVYSGPFIYFHQSMDWAVRSTSTFELVVYKVLLTYRIRYAVLIIQGMEYAYCLRYKWHAVLIIQGINSVLPLLFEE